MGADAYMAHLGVVFGLQDVYAECQIQARSVDQIVCFTRADQNTQMLPSTEIIPGSWHRIRIELSQLNPAAFDFYIDGIHIGIITPENIENQQDISGIALHLLSYSEGVNWGYIGFMTALKKRLDRTNPNWTLLKREKV